MINVEYFFVLGGLEPAGAERQTYKLAVNLKNKGHTVGIIYIRPRHELLSEFNFSIFDVVECLEVKSYFSLGGIKRLTELICNNKVGFVFSVNQYALMYCGLALSLSKYKCNHLQIFHTTIPRSYKESIMLKFLYSYFFKKLDALVYVSQNQADYWGSKQWWNVENTNVILNGINSDGFIKDLNFSPESSFESFVRSKKFLIGVNAALRPEKRHVDVLNALNILIQDGFNIGLFFIGDGPEKNNLLSTIHDLGLNSSVYLCGYQSNVIPYAIKANVFVLASDAVETFSLSILESMALGKVVIATDIGGASEQIVPGLTGSLIAPRSPEKLANELLKYLKANLDYLEMGEQAKIRFKKMFTEEKMLDGYDKLIRGLNDK